MAIRTISGAKGEILLGFKENYATDLDAFNKLVPHSFPIVSTTLNPLLEFIQSASKTRTGAQPERVINNEAADGEIITEILPVTLPYLLLAAMNSNADLTNRDPLSTGALVGTDVAATDFASGNVSTAASNEFPTLTFATPHDMGAFPGELTITFSAAQASGKVTVVGTRANGIAKSEQKPFSHTYDLGSIAASTAYKLGAWQTISSVLFSGFPDTITAGTTATLGVEDTVKKRVFELGSVQSPGIDIQGILDDIPFVMRKVILNSLILNISDTVRATLSVLGSTFDRFKMIHSDAEFLLYDGTQTDAELTNFPVPALDFYTSLGGMFQVGDEMTAAAGTDTFSAIGNTLTGRDMSVEINHNYEDATGFTGVLGGGQPQESETGRVITSNATVDYTVGGAATDVFVRWQQDARSRTKRAVRSRFFGVDGDGKKTVIECLMKACELTELPSIDSPDRSRVTVPLAYEAKAPSGATTPQEIIITTYT